MKNKFLTLIIAILSAVLMCGVCTTAFAADASSGAETKPFFNYIQPGDYFSYDKDSNVYTTVATGSVTPRLSAVDGELQTLKDTYSDDTIKFSYQYVELYDSPLAAPDWFMYFTFRNFDESPVWASGYGAHLLFYQNVMKVMVRFNNETLVETQVYFDSIYDDNYTFVDTGYHAVEIDIDDEAGKFIVYRDKGTEKEVSLDVDCNVEYRGVTRCVLGESGCYSFSARNCKTNFKDLYFFNSKNTEVDDEVARYEAYIKADSGDQGSDEGGNQGDDNNDNNDGTERGCGGVVIGSSVVAAFGLTTLGGVVLLKKKEN